MLGEAAQLGILEVTGLAFALGSDCFSVCVGLGMSETGPRRFFLIGTLFGLVQAVVVSVGYYVAWFIHWILHETSFMDNVLVHLFGAVEAREIHDGVHWMLALIGAVVLGAIGLSLVASSFDSVPSVNPKAYRGRAGIMVVALMVNIDAFSAGLGLGMMDGIFIPAVAGVMAVVGSALSVLGLRAGRRMGRRVGIMAQPIGGCILIAIAVKAFVTLV